MILSNFPLPRIKGTIFFNILIFATIKNFDIYGHSADKKNCSPQNVKNTHSDQSLLILAHITS